MVQPAPILASDSARSCLADAHVAVHAAVEVFLADEDLGECADTLKRVVSIERMSQERETGFPAVVTGATRS